MLPVRSDTGGMPRPRGKIETFLERLLVQYAELIIAVLGAGALAWIADLLTGRRGMAATGLVSATGAACGWFLCVRVFGLATLDQWLWVGWAMAGSILCLLAFFLFRSKR